MTTSDEDRQLLRHVQAAQADKAARQERLRKQLADEEKESDSEQTPGLLGFLMGIATPSWLSWLLGVFGVLFGARRAASRIGPPVGHEVLVVVWLLVAGTAGWLLDTFWTALVWWSPAIVVTLLSMGLLSAIWLALHRGRHSRYRPLFALAAFVPLPAIGAAFFVPGPQHLLVARGPHINRWNANSQKQQPPSRVTSHGTTNGRSRDIFASIFPAAETRLPHAKRRQL